MKELQTQRLLLRDFSMEDLDDFYTYCANPDVGIHAGWPAHQNKEQSEKVLRRMMESGEYWAVCERESGRNIGLVRLHPDERRKRSPQNALAMSYLLAKEQWGKGYMTEALREVLRHAFEEMGLALISVYRFSYNERSARVMEKLGFVYEGTLRQCTERFDGQLLDVLCFSLSREEYERVQHPLSVMPRLETERLILRGFTMDDLADFNAYCQNPDVGPNAGWPPHQSLEESGEVLRSFIQGGQVWAICERESGRVIGSLGLHPDKRRDLDFSSCRMLGYALAKSSWGHGYMTEAVRAALRYAFEELRLQLVTVYHFAYNQRSRRVIEKAGFVSEGTLRRAFVRYDGRIFDECSYSMTRDEWQKAQESRRTMERAIARMSQSICDLLEGSMQALYLYGSVTMDDFQPGWSDIDLVCFASSALAEEQAQKLLTLRQQLLQQEPGNPYYRSFEGVIVSLAEFLSGHFTRVVYWGTSGQRILSSCPFDAFARYELLNTGRLVAGEDIRDQLTPPTYSQLRQEIIRHDRAIRSYAVQTDETLYSCGWLLDIARGIYTLRTGEVIAKTKAGEWALQQGLCPVEKELERALQVRRSPLLYRDQPEVKRWLCTLGPAVQRFADVLEKEIARSQREQPKGILESTCCE